MWYVGLQCPTYRGRDHLLAMERMYGKSEMAGEGGLFEVKPRTPHVWRDREELPPPDNENRPVNGSAAWSRSTLLLWAVRTGRVDLLRDPVDREDAMVFHVEQSEAAAP